MCVLCVYIDCSPGALLPFLFAELFKLFKEEFLSYEDAPVPAQKIACKLRNDDVIPPAIETDIIRARDTYEAASILYRHMRDHADKESAQNLFNVMINTKCYPNMNALGQKMLDALQNVSYLE